MWQENEVGLSKRNMKSVYANYAQHFFSEVFVHVKGCLFALIFGVAALIIMALLAPILFAGADMHVMGKMLAWPTLIVGGVIGYFFGRSRE